MPPEVGRSLPKNPVLLVVDDDPSQRSLLHSFLASQGFEIIAVPSGADALTTLKNREVSMMVSDVRMPGMSGLETLRRARKEHENLPVLLVTGYADIREAVGAMRDGAVNYLSKPIDLDELLASVRKATGIDTASGWRSFRKKPLPDYVVAKSPLTQAVFRDAALVAVS